jgi:hypothetical protein
VRAVSKLTARRSQHCSRSGVQPEPRQDKHYGIVTVYRTPMEGMRDVAQLTVEIIQTDLLPQLRVLPCLIPDDLGAQLPSRTARQV